MSVRLTIAPPGGGLSGSVGGLCATPSSSRRAADESFVKSWFLIINRGSDEGGGCVLDSHWMNKSILIHRKTLVVARFIHQRGESDEEEEYKTEKRGRKEGSGIAAAAASTAL